MRFIHLADLHIGKIVNGYNMIEDQKFALEQILKLIKKENIEYAVIAGDVFDQTNPSLEAVKLVDYLFYELKKLDCKTLVISGNHDSADRLSFNSKLLKDSNLYISKSYKGEIEKVSFEDEFGKVNFYLFPYIKPQNVKPYFPEVEIHSYSDAIRTVLESIEIDENERNIILSHQFILNAERSESEEIFAGEAEAVADIFYDKFDYIALGHIHKMQSFLGGKLRYPGALLKYSASEATYKKTITIVELKEKGNLEIIEKKIKYLRDMRKITGMFDAVVESSKTDTKKDDYVHIELLDEVEIFDGYNKLKEIYPNLMSLKNSNIFGQNKSKIDYEKIENLGPIDLFSEFYLERMEKELSDSKMKIIEESVEKIWNSYED